MNSIIFEASFNIFIWLIILFGISFILDNFWKRIFRGKKYHFFLAPGIIIHELSHAFACQIVGAKIEEINFFSSQGGYVKYSFSKMSRFFRIFAEMFIGFAPVVGGIGALLFFYWILDLQLHWLSWQFWLFIYLAISIIICLTPSKQDIKNAFTGILFIFILTLIFYLLRKYVIF
jgi:hypothetical protein